VMNGTANFLLSRLAEGWKFEDAVSKAQELGFAEADPAADVDGHDAADKLSLLAREAFGVTLPTALIPRQSLRSLEPGAVRAALERGQVLKQVGRCQLLPRGGIHAEVRLESLPLGHPLAGARNEENRFLVTESEGVVHELYGKGAGRWPTAAAVFSDVMDVQRSLASLGAGEQPSEAPLLMRA
jgi:homoserine dehydrogenase